MNQEGGRVLYRFLDLDLVDMDSCSFVSEVVVEHEDVAVVNVSANRTLLQNFLFAACQ